MVTVDGAWTDALLLKARAQVALHKNNDAKSTLDQASVISPVYPYVWIEFGKLHQAEKDWDKALSAYKTTEKLRRADRRQGGAEAQVLATGLRGQAEALIELGRVDEAEALYKRCLKLDPADSAATDGLAKINASRGTPGSAGAAAPAPAPAPAPSACAKVTVMPDCALPVSANIGRPGPRSLAQAGVADGTRLALK